MSTTLTLTPARLNANRRNAHKSTGPKTTEGKAVSKLNAFKHGLCAQTVLVRGEQFSESPRDFKKLRQEFHQNLAPVGPLEEMLVDQMVQAQWRLQRARLAEAGEISLSVDEGHAKRSQVPPNVQHAQWDDGGDPVWAMGHFALGNSILAAWLRQVRQHVEQDGELSKAAVKIPLNGRPNQLSAELEEWRRQCTPPPAGMDPAVHREETKKKLLWQIDKKLRSLEWRKAGCEQREKSIEQARQSAAMLPSAETLEKILRYETALERQFYRAMNQLERLQRRREGEAIPAPQAMLV